MATQAVASSSSNASLLDRYHFVLRRLHSLSGVVPIGAFLCFHLFTNMQMMFGTFQHEVNWIHSMPALLFMEIGLLWLPIAFHAALGIVYWVSGRSNLGAYKYEGNWRYALQRWSGIIALLFIAYHVATLRWRWNIGIFTPFFAHGVTPDGTVTELAHYSTHVAMSNIAIAVFYIVGVTAAVYHFANGLWTFALSWGLTVTVAAQRRWGYVCAALGLALAGFGALAFVAGVWYEGSPREEAAYNYTLKQYKETGHFPHLKGYKDGDEVDVNQVFHIEPGDEPEADEDGDE